MTLEIITPDQILFNGEVKLVQLPGKSGSFEVLDNHAPMIASLKKGRIRIIEPDKSTREIEINGGTIKVQDNKVLILAS
ncbi:MAG: ATP synthase F1 subunit epsilon [Lentimicrobiaceae bacterium]|nr:ATP synthase F1 subunit epsilon [Lentimicrobiaceae bacterium]MCO5266830.1 ATP synthase F1 subunit epsilon [Lentimicrobium sp.]HPG32819.1 ATP synthase F1 subunit epsilon [Lentimicrobium sp.]